MKVRKLTEDFSSELDFDTEDYETFCRYYVYDSNDDCVSNEFTYEDDAIEWAKEHNYPTVKQHNYFYDERGKIRPDDGPDIVWTADVNGDDYSSAISDYRKFANIEEGYEVTPENVDEWALNEAACKNNVIASDLRHQLLGEDVTIDQAARQLEAEEVEAQSKNQIEKVLDRCLILAKRKQRSGDRSDFPNVLIVGQAGSAKTEIVRQWAADNGINLVQKNLGTMGPEAFGGIVSKDSKDPRYATRLGTNELIKELSPKNSVLFLDEYNRSKTEVRGAVLTLVQNHMVWDPTEPNSEKYLDNFLFTIAAINPSGSTYKGAKELDPAELSRFRRLNVFLNPAEHLRYLTKYYSKEIEDAEDADEKLEAMGRLAIAKKLLTNPKFKYDTVAEEEELAGDDSAYLPLNYRSFKRCLDDSDGTKDDFLDLWNDFCNYKKKPVIEDILRDYKDVEDKANDALKDGTESEVFADTELNTDRINRMFPGLNL